MPSELTQKLKSFFLEEEKLEAIRPAEEIKLALPKLKNPNLLYWLGLIPVFILALFIRTRNLPILQGKYLIELDSYFFFRYAKMLLEQGFVPAMDYMRYVPVGQPTIGGLLFPKTLVIFYKIVHSFFPNLSQIEWHVIYPPVITIISFVFFFLFVKELFNHRTAFIATAFIAVIPAYLQRTGAGFADHEAVAMLWMFICLWLFVLAWKSENWRKYLPLSAVSGIFAGLLAASWGGYALFILSVALFAFAYAFLTNSCRGHLLRFLPWTTIYLISGASFSGQSFLSFVKCISTGALLFLLLFLVSMFFVNKIQNLRKLDVPRSVIALMFSIAIALPINFIIKFIDIKGVLVNLTKHGASRLFFTISENAAPYFTDWWSSFGWTFLLAFVGITLMFYHMFKAKSPLKIHWWACVAFVIFFLAFIFGRFSTDPHLSATTNFFSNTYLYWLAGFVVMIFALSIISYYFAPKHLAAISENWQLLLIIAWLLIPLLAARGQVRLLFATVPPIAIAAGFFVSKAIDFARNLQSKVKYAVLVGLVLFSLFAFVTAAQQTALQNKYSGSMVPGQWGAAMTWIRENTTQDAVFAHWWDYGHLTVAVGQRGAVTDGGNVMGWNHQSGRYFLTGKDDNSTLTYLKTHNVTHILISEEEIPKYHAFSFIGSDENLDRRSTIGIFAMQQQKEVRNGTLFFYAGGWPFDKDYLLGKLVLPEGNAGIGGLSFVIQNDSIAEPKAHVIFNEQQYEFPISCVIVQGKKLFFEVNDSLGGCAVLVPSFDQSGRGNPVGGAFWLSEKAYDTNLAKLYIYNETSLYFELVYDDSTPLAIYQGRVIGPIKIWEVHYPDEIKPDPFYLQPSPQG